MTPRLRGCAWVLALTVVSGLGLAHSVSAHPMPNTEIVISPHIDGVRFAVAVPAPELRLALPQSWPGDADLLAEPQRSAVIQYFRDHIAIQTAAGAAQRFELESLGRWQGFDDNVGQYEELRLQVFAPARDGFNPRSFTLHYDAVIHQVPNHFALVYTAQDSRSHEPGDGSLAGAIRYDFSRDVTPPLAVNMAPGSAWQALPSVIALGFQHVISGLDHLLFLVTLLVVAPLRRVDGAWSLFQGWHYTIRRFFSISLAFTAGHSLALLLGVFALIPVPGKAVEVLIAGSILLAAVHAMRPLFPEREWLVAGGFGTVHGLAFAESLATHSMAPGTRALTVLGFNIGVEGAQLVAMAAAVPLLFASRWRWFHVLRMAMMVGTATLAVLWMLERFGLTGL